jgi:ferredoxin
LPDTEGGLEQWLELNTKYSAEWPNITSSRDAPEDADEHKGEEGKFEKYFSPDPGQGD